MPKEVKWAISIVIGLGLLSLGWKVYFVLVTLHVLVCGLLIIVVLLQSGEAADLAGAFGGAGSQTAFGPRGAATFLSKATTWCAIMFMLTSMAMTMRQNSTAASSGSSVLQQFSKTGKPAVPALPVHTGPVPTPETPVPAAPNAATPAPSAPAPTTPSK
jgi:preprotein translocase subunit SecG